MKHQHHFETTAARQTTRARALIVDVYRTAQILNIATTAEQDRAEVCDRFLVEYPTHARELEARRDNLTDTIAGLEQRTWPPFVRHANVASAMEHIGRSPRWEGPYDLAI
jgi:hypothetical protein